MTDFPIEPLAEDALLLRFGDGIDMAINARVHAAAQALRLAGLPGITDIAPAYATLLVRFDLPAWADGFNPEVPPHQRFMTALRSALAAIDFKSLDSRVRGNDAQDSTTSIEAIARRIEIPVCYGGDCGADLDAVAAHTGLARDEVIARHTAAEYTVAMLGFAPGFPYLLGLDPALHVPRRATPRTRVPAGSVAIGGAQTGIYPCELPGGWHLIGHTPLVLFDPRRDLSCLLAPGDRVRFRGIDTDEFARLAEREA